jgi:hypothetical protein
LGMDLGSDGTFWGVSGDRIRRFDGDQWREWPLRNPKRQPMAVSVAPDGSVWLGFWYNARGKPVCKDGVGHFDGVTWDYYLHDLCVRSMDVDGGGSVWVLGDDGDLYVITPEAMAVSAGLG